MKIYLSEITRESQVHLTLTPPREWVDSLFEDSDTWADDCRVEVEVTRMGRELLTRGEMACHIHTVCSRCLEEAAIPVRAPFALLFRVGAPDVPFLATESSEEGEAEVLPFDGEMVDLSDMMRELVLVSLPMKPLCQEDCKGLCAQCGSNLNLEPCQCRKISLSPFDNLKKLM